MGWPAGGRSEVGVPHQVLVHGCGAVAAFAQGPDHQALAAAHIAAGKDAGHGGGKAALGGGAAALSQGDAEALRGIRLAAGEACRDEGKLAGVLELLAGGDHPGAASRGVGLGAQPGDDRAGQPARLVLQEGLDGGLVDPRVAAEAGGALGLAVVGLFHPGPLGPGVRRGAGGGGLGHHLEGEQPGAALPQGGALAVVAGVAPADDQDVLPFRRDGRRRAVQQAAGGPGEVIHREQHPLRVPPGDVEVPGLLCPAAEDHRVVVCQHLGGVHRPAHVHPGQKLDPFGLHDADPALHHLLFQLHAGDAVHQKAAGAVLPLVDGDGVAALVEVIGDGEARRPRPDDGDALAGAGGGRGGLDPSPGVARLDDGALVLTDGDRAAGHLAAGAGGFAQSRADPAGELGKAVGGKQAAQRKLPPAMPEQLVPLGDEVVQRAARGRAAQDRPRLAEGHAAVHAAAGLGLLFFPRQPGVKFAEVRNPREGLGLGAGLARGVDESGDLSHGVVSPLTVSAGRRRLRSAPVRRPGRALPSRRWSAASGRSRRAAPS